MATATNQLRSASGGSADRGASPVPPKPQDPTPGSSPLRRKQPEADLQRAIVKFLRKSLVGNSVVFHIPNGGLRSFTEAKRFKEMGVLPGMVDLGVINDGRLIGLEVKPPKGGTVSDAQAWCHRQLRAAGAWVFIVRSLDDVIAAMQQTGVPMRIKDKFL